MQNVPAVFSRAAAGDANDASKNTLQMALQMTTIQSLLDIVSYATITLIIAGFMSISPKASADKGDFSK